MTKVAIHQPNYLPWLGYFYKILKCDVFVILDNVQYEKNSFINRNKIKTAQGPAWLTVDTITRGHATQLIHETLINNGIDWRKRHWRTISQNYSRSANFTRYSSVLEQSYAKNWEKLSDLNQHLVMEICQMLSITRPRFVNASSLNAPGASTELLANICRAVGGDVYLSGLGAVDYMESEIFQQASIKLEYSDFKHPAYRQMFGDFIPNLSIIDLLFNEGENSRQILEESAR